MTHKSFFEADMKQSDRKAAHRAAILDAAEILLAQCGEGASIEAIADRAGLAKGTVYNHFADKDALLAAVALRVRKAAAAKVAEVVSQIEDAPSRVAAGMNVYLCLARNDPNRGAILARIIQESVDPSAPINAALMSEIERGIARGEFHAHPARAGVATVLALVQAAMTFVIGSSYRARDNEAAAALLDHAIYALTGRKEKSSAAQSSWVAD